MSSDPGASGELPSHDVIGRVTPYDEAHVEGALTISWLTQISLIVGFSIGQAQWLCSKLGRVDNNEANKRRSGCAAKTSLGRFVVKALIPAIAFCAFLSGPAFGEDAVSIVQSLGQKWAKAYDARDA